MPYLPSLTKTAGRRNLEPTAQPRQAARSRNPNIRGNPAEVNLPDPVSVATRHRLCRREIAAAERCAAGANAHNGAVAAYFPTVTLSESCAIASNRTALFNPIRGRPASGPADIRKQFQSTGGEGGIRTHGAPHRAQRFSRPPRS